LHNASPGLQLAGTSLLGGVTSEIGGGDFWQGAANGATIGLLNHLAHRGDGENTHTVKKGERLSNIAAKYYMSVEELIKLNDLDKGYPTLRPGMKLKIITGRLLLDANYIDLIDPYHETQYKLSGTGYGMVTAGSTGFVYGMVVGGPQGALGLGLLFGTLGGGGGFVAGHVLWTQSTHYQYYKHYYGRIK